MDSRYNKCIILAAYAKELGLTEEQALKIAYFFNSGMRKGEI